MWQRIAIVWRQRKFFRRCVQCSLAVVSMMGCQADLTPADHPGDPQHGKTLLRELGCGSCHVIPGISSAQGRVGPTLAHLAQRGYLAGVLPNTFDNLVLWIRDPQAVAPRSAMPTLGVSQDQARDMAAYLYTLK